MAEDLGTRELGTVRSQRLDELLSTLRLLQDPSANTKFGIPALDRLLATNTPRLDPTNLSSIPAPSIIEITSPVPKSGKTELLYWIIAKLVLGDLRDKHEQYHDHANDSTEDGLREVLGQEEDVLMKYPNDQITESETGAEVQQTTHLLDEPPEYQPNPNPNPQLTTHHPTHPTAIALLSTTPISLPRLGQVLLHHLLTAQPHLSLPTTQEIIHEALHHIHIFTPPSLPSLISTISTLPAYFLNPSNKSFDRKLVIMIDSASANFWEDKIAGSERQGGGRYAALAAVVKRISGQLQASVVFTTEHSSPTTASASASTSTSTLTSTTSSTAETTALKPQLPPPWPILPSLRLVIKKTPIVGFGKEIDAATAVKQREARDKAVRDAGFEVCVNEWGNEGWVNNRKTQGFKLRIDGKGVELA